jgi:hypothetical protein
MTEPKKAAVCKRCAADPQSPRHACSKCGRSACSHLSVEKKTPGFFGDKKSRLCGPCNLQAARGSKKAS